MLSSVWTYSGFTYIVIACLALEAIGLFALWHLRRKGLRPLQTIAFLGAGGSFAVALLIVSQGAPLPFLAASLGFAFAFHLLDIVLRWQK
jgi:hypothetical protein